ncbi:serine incorporator domain containing protein [Nitzschia inconspicua]|uniref:Serine incorporator domain containing protein n=1 Tax=Nitzschia inconspicua TaxID=303405 RepID=A0A9K3LFH0_9STRA|nr:serine incorporator domain containing protein [Nitzschia inconspicua]KAG7360804.1 serine incorporator domain containing protein [Nitzschia inconspicua]
MASILTCVATGAAWCFCTAATSLLSSCCGNDKPSHVAPGASSGRKRSVLLLLLSIGIAFAFQYGVAPYIVGISISNYVTNAWLSGCEDYETDTLMEACAGQNGVYRSALAALIFYILAAIAVAFKRTANREAWPAKYVLFLFLVLGFCFVPNDPLFSDIYMNIARIGGIVFILFQQVVFVDLAYNWNDGWVEKSNQAESEEMGSGKKWLVAILVSAISLFVLSIVGWALLFYFFGGCGTNVAFITVTIILALMVTVAQLWGTEGSLLSSSIISAYATMLCYNAVTRNPDPICNPQLGGDDTLSIVIGVGLTIVSLGYVGWSTTADRTLGRRGEDDEEGNALEVGPSQSTAGEEKAKVGGVVTNNYKSTNDAEAGGDAAATGPTEEEGPIPNTFSNNWKLNIALAVVTCFVSMALTGWGSIEANGNVANPQVGKASMWIIIASQWVAMLLYVWTLVAPRLFPDRDFS